MSEELDKRDDSHSTLENLEEETVMSQGFGIESVDTNKGSRRSRKPTQVAEIQQLQQNVR
jgi:hypothetical protein